MLLAKCEVCDSKELKFIKEQEARGLLNSSGTKTALSKSSFISSSFVSEVLKS